MSGLSYFVLNKKEFNLLFVVFVIFQVIIKVLFRLLNFEFIRKLFIYEYMTEEDEMKEDMDQELGTYNRED